MKTYPSGVIVPEQIVEVPLLKALRGTINRGTFRGTYWDQLIKTTRPHTFQGFGENKALPTGQAPAYIKAQIPIRQVIATAQLTSQVMDQAGGGDASWGNAVDIAISDMKDDFNLGLERCIFGQGLGALARIVSVSDGGSPNVVTCTCDNTYTDFGIENVQLLKVGDHVDIYTSTSATLTDQTITAVTFGDRANGVATTGTFTFTHATGHGLADNDIVYLAGTYAYPLPMGLSGIIQDGSHYSGVAQVGTFQGLTRTSYPCLMAKVYDAADFAAGGVAGTPDDWDLSVISTDIRAAEKASGSKVDALACASELAMAIMRRNRTESVINVVTSAVGQGTQEAVGSLYAQRFLCPDGRTIPIIVADTISANSLYGICRADLTWHVLPNKPSFDYLRLYGDIWGPTKGDSYANFEAPYAGYYNIGARRCDSMFVIHDMKTNI
jgi:hypothetical protein